MSKGQRLREQNARQRIAAQQAAARRAEMRRRAMILGGSLVSVIAVVAALLIWYNVNKPGKSTASVNGAALPASVVSNITSVPAATLAGVGAGSVPSFANTSYVPPPVTPVSGAALTSGGKPEMLYIGAEYCPYCGAMRWSMAVALSRFGAFTTQLHGIHSSATDVNPNTPTLTFYKTGYASKYLVFTPVENEDMNRKTLQATTAGQQAVWAKYDASSSGLGYPFIDFGNQAVIKGPLYSPSVLKGLTWAQVAADLHNPSSPVAQAVLGTANYITAGICKMTGNTPSTVCSASSISKLEAGI
jgi:hypothetical protein